jgi:hypothetical protein
MEPDLGAVEQVAVAVGEDERVGGVPPIRRRLGNERPRWRWGGTPAVDVGRGVWELVHDTVWGTGRYLGPSRKVRNRGSERPGEAGDEGD